MRAASALRAPPRDHLGVVGVGIVEPIARRTRVGLLWRLFGGQLRAKIGEFLARRFGCVLRLLGGLRCLGGVLVGLRDDRVAVCLVDLLPVALAGVSLRGLQRGLDSCAGLFADLGNLALGVARQAGRNGDTVVNVVGGGCGGRLLGRVVRGLGFDRVDTAARGFAGGEFRRADLFRHARGEIIGMRGCGYRRGASAGQWQVGDRGERN